MRSTARRLCLLFLFSLLAACGGGGGKGGDGGSTGTSASLSLQSNNVSYTASIGQYDATQQTITGNILNPGDTTYYLYVNVSKTNLVAYADVAISGNQGYLTLFPNSATNLEPGVHTGTISVFACTDANCSKQLKGSPQTISVRYEVLYDAKVADVDRDGIVDANDPFPKVANRAPLVSTEPQFYADAGKRFTLSASSFIQDPDGDVVSYHWQQFNGRTLLANEHSGDTLSVAVPSDVSSAETLNFLVTATDAYGVAAQIRLDLTLLPALSYSLSDTRLSAYLPGATPSFSLQIDAHDTASWQLSSATAGVSLSTTQGSGSQQINGTIDTTGLAIGTHPITLNLTDVRQAITHHLTLEVIAQQDRPVVLKNGAALSKVGDKATLSSRFTVLSERGDSAMAWTASSNQPWLSLSRTQGVAGDMLTVTADPTMLANDQQYHAEITLIAPGSSTPEKVAVGLYLSSATAAAQTTITSSAVMKDIASDPVRPYVYTVAGTGKLYVYDAYTATEVAAPTIGGNLNSIAISHDGARIFAFDSLEKRIFVINPASFDIEQQFSLAGLSGVSAQGLTYLRPKGLGMLLMGGHSLILASDGTILHADHLNTAATYVSESQDQVLQGFISNSNYYDIYSLTLSVDPLTRTAQVAATLALNTGGGYGFPIDFASNRDMSKVWISTGAQVEIYNFSPQQGFTRLGNTDGSLGWQNALEPSPDYNSYYLGQDYSNNATVCAFTLDLNLELGCINPPSQDVAIRMLKLSSDGQRGIVFSDSDYYDDTSQPITFFNALH